MTVLTVGTLIAAALYLLSGLSIIRAMRGKDGKAAPWLRWPILIALLIHAWALHGEMFQSDAVHFGFGYAVSETSFMAMLILLIETWIHRLHGQFGIALVFASIGTVLPAIFVGQPIQAAEWTQLFRWHLFFAIAGYAFMFIAVVQALLMRAQNLRLKHPIEDDAKTDFLDSMPGLIVMERIFFRIVMVGFLCITITLVLGALATFEAYGSYFHLDHKTVLTYLSWIIFAILLAGRYLAGWRAKTALRWFWVGVGLFVIAYFGYSFALEMVN